jgi:hypothetical protein
VRTVSSDGQAWQRRCPASVVRSRGGSVYGGDCLHQHGWRRSLELLSAAQAGLLATVCSGRCRSPPYSAEESLKPCRKSNTRPMLLKKPCRDQDKAQAAYAAASTISTRHAGG